MIKTEYTVKSTKVKSPHTFAMLSDFHNRKKNMAPAFDIVKSENVEVIFVVGDLVDRHKKIYDLAIPFLEGCMKLAPTYMSLGNHEIKFPVLTKEDFEKTGAVVLQNDFVDLGFMGDAFRLGGQIPYENFDWVDDFEKTDSFKICLSHHPETYKHELKTRNIDLILSGHAHGGQIRVLGHGVLAPNQGLFPKYTYGFHDNKLIVGTGLSNTGGIVPRWGNPTEVLIIKVVPENCVDN